MSRRICHEISWIVLRTKIKLTHRLYHAKVRDEHKEALKSITHIDGTCRLQTVTREQNQFIYDLLSQECLSQTPVLLNTSFNINGKPILSKVETALEILDETEIDAVVIEDTIFESND